ncbi:MAG TPA: hypothetical protein V6C95_04350 [Coleofasciculaceae cyanobacterium]
MSWLNLCENRQSRAIAKTQGSGLNERATEVTSHDTISTGIKS